MSSTSTNRSEQRDELGPATGIWPLGAGAIHATAAGIHAEHGAVAAVRAVARVRRCAGCAPAAPAAGSPPSALRRVNAAAVVAGPSPEYAASRGSAASSRPRRRSSPTRCAPHCGSVIGHGRRRSLHAAGRRAVTAAPASRPAIAIAAVTSPAHAQRTASHVHTHDDSARRPRPRDRGAPTAAETRAPTAATETPPCATATRQHRRARRRADEAQPTRHRRHRRHGGDTAAAAGWPRPWDPTQPIDFSGVPGVTPEQQARAEALVATRSTSSRSSPTSLRSPALGYQSIGDAGTGYEHYINYG